MDWNSFFENLFKNTPGWFFVFSSIIILIMLTAVAIWIVLGTKRFSESLGKENRLIELKDEVYKLTRENEHNKDASSKLLTVIENSRLFLNTLNGDKEGNVDYSAVVQRIN